MTGVERMLHSPVKGVHCLPLLPVFPYQSFARSLIVTLVVLSSFDTNSLVSGSLADKVAKMSKPTRRLPRNYSQS